MVNDPAKTKPPEEDRECQPDTKITSRETVETSDAAKKCLQDFPNIARYLFSLKSTYSELDVSQHINLLSQKWLSRTLEWIEYRFNLPHPRVSEIMLANSVKGIYPIQNPESYPKNSLVKIIRSSGEVYPVVFRDCFNDDVSFVLPSDINIIDDHYLEKKSYQKYKDFFYELTSEEKENCMANHPLLRKLSSI